MVSNKTYNNVVNTLCRIGQYHLQIASVSVGDIYDINLENQKFPLLHINPTSVQTGDSELVYNFQIFICDLVSEKSDWQTEQASLLTKLVDPKNNEQQVWNQTLAIATDIIGMLRHSSRQSLAMTLILVQYLLMMKVLGINVEILNEIKYNKDRQNRNQNNTTNN
jgi:hypothetical protein